MLLRFLTHLSFLVLFAFLAHSASAASPREELLRVAPPDAALLLLVQNANDRVQNIEQSPFAKWFPQSALGKQILSGVDLKQAQSSLAPIFAALEIKPEELLADVFGEAVAFAYTPTPNDDPKGERAVVIVRPRKPETLARLVAKLNEIQLAGGEVKAVLSRRHNGEEYFERQKPGGTSDFYCFRGSVFAFSGTEPDIQAIIDRDKADKPSVLPAKLAKLGVEKSFVVALINPRSFDAEVKAKAAKAKGADRVLLERFQEIWLALDSAAISLDLDAGLEAGVSLQFQPNKLPVAARTWLTGVRQNAAIWQAIPESALFALAGNVRIAEAIESLGSLAAADGANPLKTAAEQLLGPVFGKDKLPQVLAALGPQWAFWIEQPSGNGFLPEGVAVVQIDSTGPKGKAAAREISRAVGFGFNTARIAYNATHTDQIEIDELDDGGVLITSLVNEKGFPAGFRPSYAFKAGYLLVATSPEAIQRFQEPKPGIAKPEATLSRVSGAAIRVYLHTHREKLAKFLAAAGQGNEADVLKQFEQLATVLELVDRLEIVTRGDEGGIRLSARIQFAKPLRK